MSSMVTSNMDHLIRSELWTGDIKGNLLDELSAQKYVRWLTNFPDGTTLTIPSIGEASVQSITENVDIDFEKLVTGEFQFTINEYVASGHYITRKALMDSYWGPQVLASFVPKQSRALSEYVETRVLAAPSPGVTNGQTILTTSTDPNAVNGVKHRFFATGTSNVVQLKDFAYAKLALKKARVPLMGLVAIVDPSVGYNLETLTNVVNVSNNPRWEGIVQTGVTTGMSFIKNIYGFDVYESNYLANGPADLTTDGSTYDTDGTSTATANYVQNLFFAMGAGGDVIPIIGAWRQMPTVDSDFDIRKQREEYVTTSYFDVSQYRPENMVCVLSDSTQIS